MKSRAWHPPENPRQKTPPRSIPGSAARGLRAAAAQRRAGSSGGLRASPADGCHLLLAPRATAGAQKHGKKTKPQPAGSGRDEVCSSQGSKKPFGVFKGMRNATYIGPHRPPRRVGGGPALLLLLKAAPVASFLCTTVAETPIPRDLPGITLPGMHGSSRGCRAKGHRPHGAAAFLPPSQQFTDLSPFLACSGKASKGAGSERQPI